MKKKTIKAKIISNRNIAPDHYEMAIEAPYLGRNSCPGQFVSVRAQEGVTDPLLRIPLGVHAIKKNGIHLLYKVVGPGTELLRARRKGETIDVLGPLGNGFDLAPLLREKDSRAILVAGGHGVAPLYALAEAIIKQKRQVDVFIGACTKKHVVGADKFKKLGAKVHIATEDGTRCHKGYVTEILKKHLDRVKGQGARVKVYACGPRPMAGALAKVTDQFGIVAQVSLDAYMACGIGACLGCPIETVDGYKLVCKDGPVFDAEDIVWESM